MAQFRETSKEKIGDIGKKYQQTDFQKVLSEALVESYYKNMEKVGALVPIDFGTLRNAIQTYKPPRARGRSYELGTPYRPAGQSRPLLEILNTSKTKKYAVFQRTNAGKKRPSHNPKNLQGKPLHGFWDKLRELMEKDTTKIIVGAVERYGKKQL